MMLYCFTGSDDKSQENLQITIYNKVNLRKYEELLTDKEKNDLDKLNLLKGCHMWGAEPGPQNSTRWEKVKSGDRIIGFSNKKFICYGPILYKIHNKKLAEAVWGTNKEGETWEYINVFGELQYIDLSRERLNYLFEYKHNRSPQGFSNIRAELIKKIEKEYGSIDEAISLICDEKLHNIEDKMDKQSDVLGEVEVESSINKMSDEQFIKYIKSLDSSASLETVKKCVKIRKYNKKLIDDMKKRANNTCQVCGCTCGNEHGVSIAEAHHINKFSLTQNNKPENILILCPNHHRLIHKSKAVIDIDAGIVTYGDGTNDKFIKLV
ncbi:HNH endonuclease signature motif containing protein [Clostridium butyricum]|uniref:HNH endonuclease signature motif containing protein n=1 Tax=Clostridium butyricum TaxID=1492 RepID=UPI002ABE3D70|nr:HNH endonuclease signature motif containing protein [Clostridium butyricum]